MEEKKFTSPMELGLATDKIHQVAKNNREKLEEDFNAGILHLVDYSGVKKFKSIRRAIKRGHVSIFGEIYPHRPFKNISSKRGSLNFMQKRYYEQLTHKNRMYN